MVRSLRLRLCHHEHLLVLIIIISRNIKKNVLLVTWIWIPVRSKFNLNFKNLLDRCNVKYILWLHIEAPRKWLNSRTTNFSRQISVFFTWKYETDSFLTIYRLRLLKTTGNLYFKLSIISEESTIFGDCKEAGRTHAPLNLSAIRIFS